jgi:hypothetical protein
MSSRIAGVAAFLSLASAAFAAQDSQEALARKRDQKLQAAFLKKAAWTTDYDKAREEARKSGKLIFAYFTRSYSP